MNYEDIEYLRHIQGVHNNVFKWCDSQGSTYGIKSLRFRTSSPNKEADDLGLHKDGRSCRSVLLPGMPKNLFGCICLSRQQKRIRI